MCGGHVLEQTKLDQAKADVFAQQMLTVINHSGLALMISIGHRVKLFDTLAGLSWVTSTQLAEAARLNERYVREWLAAMATGGVVDHDATASTFRLPPEHAAWLTRAAGTPAARMMSPQISSDR